MSVRTSAHLHSRTSGGTLTHAPPLGHQQDPAPRLRPHRDRPGRRVRLLGRPGLQGAARGGLRDRPRQLEPGHDHDRSGVRHRHLHRAAHPRLGRARDREGAPRRAAADARRRHRAQPRPPAARVRHARALRRRADRRELRRHHARRGPAALPRDDGARRPPGAAQHGRAQHGRRRARARVRRAAGDLPAGLHDGRRRRRHRLQRDRVPRAGGGGPGRQPDR